LGTSDLYHSWAFDFPYGSHQCYIPHQTLRITKKKKRTTRKKRKENTPCPLVRKQTIPTERPPLVSEIYCQHLREKGCRVVSAADPLRSLISVFSATFLSSSSSFMVTRAEWTPFQTHWYSENLAAPGIELGTSGLAARNSDH
jgi:hypothetical protein